MSPLPAQLSQLLVEPIVLPVTGVVLGKSSGGNGASTGGAMPLVVLRSCQRCWSDQTGSRDSQRVSKAGGRLLCGDRPVTRLAVHSALDLHSHVLHSSLTRPTPVTRHSQIYTPCSGRVSDDSWRRVGDTRLCATLWLRVYRYSVGQNGPR